MDLIGLVPFAVLTRQNVDVGWAFAIFCLYFSLNANAEQEDCITCRQSEISHFCSGARPTAQRQPPVGGMGCA